VRRLCLLATVLIALGVAPAADAGPLLGVVGDSDRFRSLTGQVSDVRLAFAGWGQGYSRGRQFEDWFPLLGDVPMLGLGTKNADGSEGITPRGIARGRGDAYLIDLNREAALWGRRLYVRPLAEMNGHWNPYCAYNADGSFRGRAHSTKNFRKAFRRMYLILHGGSRGYIDGKLAKFGMPPLRTSGDLPAIPYPRMRVLWNPQGFGSPNIHKNRAAAYYPGDNFVDVVGNDLYDIRYRATWEANEKLYADYPRKPYAIGEFGLWGIDDPAFIRRMAKFVKEHRRTQVIVYYESKKGSVFDLGSKPDSRAAYRKYITPLGG
jgi:hypothetical protein